MNSSWRSILALIVFLLTNLVGVFPIKVPIPYPARALCFVERLASRLRICNPSHSCCHPHPTFEKGAVAAPRHQNSILWHKFTIGFQTAPLTAVLFLLATGVLHGVDVRIGIIGSGGGGVVPLDIMALFISLAYIAISLDVTGLFRFLAFWVVRKGGSSGRKLYLYLYIFWFLTGVFVGNDPVILFGTPFLAYFARVTGIVPPTAWIFAQFATANMASGVFPSSNPTNLVLTEAFHFSFISYTAHMVLPALAAGVAVYFLLRFALFRSREQVPKEIDVVELSPEPLAPPMPENPPKHVLRGLHDINGAIFGSVLFAITLGVLIGTSILHIPVYQITIPAAVLMLARDIWHDRQQWKSKSEKNAAVPVQPEAAQLESGASTTVAEMETASRINDSNEIQVKKKDHGTLSSYIDHLKKDRLPTVMTILPRLPVSMILFAICMFILVQALTAWGWVEVFAGWWAAWIRACEDNGTASATVGAVTLMLVLSTILCNICGTNIGTTILLARVLQSWLENNSPIDPKVRVGSIFALAVGTNFGAFTFSFSASLAGLLWRDILRQKGIIVHQTQFALLNLPIIVVAVAAAAAVLVAEVYIVPR
ncbi:uncharacterized protein FOMMEDRAFT_122033 [Fomitiporia mediterranea MF3/22]|uniref:uncharacterized protein n=1 Tax=Fomitiporia mediterranea (strain MF3/22) TaxID=694068 RepID=UPI0004407D48|nr:uncharacterized protein FOMMEDRAFT_122033 [Fomitiporia mediterranea MF3/22]EJD04337.1 hypothetical protein FOMMEDRAFT_122033 [Fomitiporia mediterranea MF3/22]